MHATAFLKSPNDVPLPGVIVIFGGENWLKYEALHAITTRLTADAGEDAMLTRFAGDDLDLKTLVDELRTVSMWGDGRVAIVDDGDAFVTNYRAGLENYVAAPAKNSTLILLVKKWPKTTRLAKAVAKTGLPLECGELKGAALTQFVAAAAAVHGKRISRAAAGVLVELAGGEPGQLTQEAAKLAAYVGERDRITEDDIRAVVGGWSTQTAFEMVEALMNDRLDRALELLDQLLSAGEAPPRIHGAIAYCFRQLATATESARHGTPLREAVAKAGVYYKRIDAAAAYLRRIGRPRAETILPNLVAVDASLKGGSRAADGLELEQLLVRFSGRLPVEG